MTKRKILLLAMSLCMVAILAVGGTLAYFTDSETKTNVFTYGDIDITLNEDFPEDELMPGAENALTKIVKVENTGANDAYMWIEIWVPAAIEDANAANNDLHWNYFNTYKDSEGNEVLCYMSEAEAKGYELVAETVCVGLGSKDIDEVEYNGYRIYIKDDEPKANGEETAALLSRVYMDKRIDTCKDADCENGEDCLVLVGGEHYVGPWEIIVYAYGIQAQGFVDNGGIVAAIEAYGVQNGINETNGNVKTYTADEK